MCSSTQTEREKIQLKRQQQENESHLEDLRLEKVSRQFFRIRFVPSVDWVFLMLELGEAGGLKLSVSSIF